MRAYCYFVEPASYTVDLIENIYKKIGIPYTYILDKTFAISSNFHQLNQETFLSKKSILNKIRHLYIVWKNNDLIIINGYNNYVFLFTFFFNFFSLNRRYIAIDSDTQLNIPVNIFKRIIKSIYLRFIFRSKSIFGFSGGSKYHKDLFRYYGMNEDRIFLMPMMVNNNKFYQNKINNSLSFNFLYVGRLVKSKNVEFLLRTFKKFFSNKDAVLRIVGSGYLDNYLRKEYASDRIIFVGKKIGKELICEYQNASVLVCPSIFEPWGLVVNEALSSGTPVIASKHVGASYDLIYNKETGIIFNDKDKGPDLGDAMLLLFNNKKLRTEYSINATLLMRNYWNYDLYKTSLLKAINDICKK